MMLPQSRVGLVLRSCVVGAAFHLHSGQPLRPFGVGVCLDISQGSRAHFLLQIQPGLIRADEAGRHAHDDFLPRGELGIGARLGTVQVVAVAEPALDVLPPYPSPGVPDGEGSRGDPRRGSHGLPQRGRGGRERGGGKPRCEQQEEEHGGNVLNVPREDAGDELVHDVHEREAAQHVEH